MEDDRGASCKVFIGGLPLETTEGDLRKLAGADSTYCEVIIPQEKNKPNNRANFAFLTVPQAVASRLINEEQFVLGRRVDCQLALSRCEKTAYQQDLLRRKIFVDKLPISVDDIELHKGLKKHGKVRNFYTAMRNDGMSRICIAEFARSRDASSIIRNGLMYKKKHFKVARYLPPKGIASPAKENNRLQKMKSESSSELSHERARIGNAKYRSKGPEKISRNTTEGNHVIEHLQDVNHQIHVKFNPNTVHRIAENHQQSRDNCVFNIVKPNQPGFTYKKEWCSGTPVYFLQASSGKDGEQGNKQINFLKKRQED